MAETMRMMSVVSSKLSMKSCTHVLGSGTGICGSFRLTVSCHLTVSAMGVVQSVQSATIGPRWGGRGNLCLTKGGLRTKVVGGTTA